MEKEGYYVYPKLPPEPEAEFNGAIEDWIKQSKEGRIFGNGHLLFEQPEEQKIKLMHLQEETKYNLLDINVSELSIIYMCTYLHLDFQAIISQNYKLDPPPNINISICEFGGKKKENNFYLKGLNNSWKEYKKSFSASNISNAQLLLNIPYNTIGDIVVKNLRIVLDFVRI